MEILFLGTGTSQGVPMIGCRCPVCSSEDPRDRRTRTSIHVRLGPTSIQVDAAPELRLQCLSAGIQGADVFILTHGHADHLLGMDDLRRFCDLRGGRPLPVYSTEEGLARVRQVYPYAADRDAPVASGYPAFQLRRMPPCLEVPGGRIYSTLLPHGSIQTLGLVFEESGGGRFTYFTDCKSVSIEQRQLARGSSAVVLDGLRPEPHPSHMSLAEAVSCAADIGAPRTFITHLTHQVGHRETSARLPPGVELAYDGLRLMV